MAYNGRLELTWTNKDQALISSTEGKYGYEWVDPSDHRAQEVRLLNPVGTVEAEDGRPEDLRDGDDALPEPTHDNLLITGEAAHALNALLKTPELAEKYAGQVKLIYIDPPFNTGKTFTHYQDSLEHSVWLTMMRDRVRQAKDLLREDGSIWVHLDHSESHRMRMVLDEAFGTSAFVADIVWQKADTTRDDAGGLSRDHDTILVYKASAKWRPNRFGRSEEDNLRFTSPDGDPDPWWDDNPTAPSGKSHQGMIYAIQHPITGQLNYPAANRCWYFEQPTMHSIMNEYAPYKLVELDDAVQRAAIAGVEPEEVRQGVKALLLDVPLEEAAARARARYGKGNWPSLVLRGEGGAGGGFGKKAYIPAGGKTISTWWPNDEVGHNREAKAETKALFGKKNAFATPKPERLLQRIIHVGSDPGDIVLDFFCGAGTTAAVAHKMGRRWVTSELLPTTVNKFALPRLTHVVEGTDKGGITIDTSYLPAGELPKDVITDQAREFTFLLGKFARLADDSQGRRGNKYDDPQIQQMVEFFEAFAKPTTVKTQIWYGGGSFHHLEVGPSMFESLDGHMFLADWCRDQALSRAVATQLEFEYREGTDPFCGSKGRKMLAVLDGAVTAPVVQFIQSALTGNHVVTIYATNVDPTARAVLKRGCTLEKIPAAILDSYRRTVRKARPVDWLAATPNEEN